MNTLPILKILRLHGIVCVAVILLSLLICYFWYMLLSRPDNLEDQFRHSETLQLLQIVIGFTYIGVIRSFFDSLERKTALVAEINTLFDPNKKLPHEFVDTLIGLCKEHKNIHKNSWSYWSKQGVGARWKTVFTKVSINMAADHGHLFNFLGPWTAIAVFYFFHPPVAYRENGSIVAWITIYSGSISILFSFLMTMWITERAHDVGLIKRNGYLYTSTIQHYMETSTAHLRIANRPHPYKTSVNFNKLVV